ncbi:MAG: PhoPQ-activated pathogenicity-related family protein [Fimbriimonadaceae bacterium]|nr:PhoPQ-activated pathogenicity-related family protein [Fimbriimonadaceae bacterium]
MIALLISLLTSPKEPQALQDYLKRPEPSFVWKRVEDVQGMPKIHFTSQRWQGRVWEHDIIIANPAKPLAKGTAVLFITGGQPGADDLLLLKTVTNQSGLPTAVLFDIPNQPLWGMSEDDLIAHTFEKYLETGDATWPLLFPMAKSAIKAMDAIQAFTKNSDNPITKFVVTGASKRGWTTWFVGASGDKRVKGIAPLVIDNLNVGAQMKHQMDSWGKYSEQIEEYTRRGLQAKLATPEGQKLAAMVDPFSYRARFKMPTMIVNGGNDRYWTVDALSLYWDELKQPKWAVVVPNAGHDLGDQQWALRGVTAFARSCAGLFKMPKFGWEFSEDRVWLKDVKPAASMMRVWSCEADSLDFRDSKWSVIAEMRSSDGLGGPMVRFKRSGKNQAVFAELQFKIDGYAFSLTTPVKVYRAGK